MIAKQDNSVMANKPHILVVDDDIRISHLVSRFLTENGFIALKASSAAEAREMLNRFHIDALVVDVMMPGQTGLDFTRELRKNSLIPILLLTALGETHDRIAGLESGADDYLPKPFEPRELVLRLNAILRRAPKIPNTPKVYKIGNWEYYLDQEELVDKEIRVRLTTVEVNLLRVLLEKCGEVMSREELALRCGLDTGERTIDVQVTRLRRKIEDDTKAPRFLQTVRGKGYLLRAEKL